MYSILALKDFRMSHHNNNKQMYYLYKDFNSKEWVKSTFNNGYTSINTFLYNKMCERIDTLTLRYLIPDRKYDYWLGETGTNIATQWTLQNCNIVVYSHREITMNNHHN